MVKSKDRSLLGNLCLHQLPDAIARSLTNDFATKICSRYNIPCEGLSLDAKRQLIIEHQSHLIAARQIFQWRSLMLKYSHRKEVFTQAFIEGSRPYILKRLWAPDSEYRRASYSRFGGDYQEPPSSTERDTAVAPAPKRFKKTKYASPLLESYQNLIQEGIFDEDAAVEVDHPMNGHPRDFGDFGDDGDNGEDFMLREGRFPAATNDEFQFSTPYNPRKNFIDTSDSEDEHVEEYPRGFRSVLGSQIQAISNRLAAVEVLLSGVSEGMVNLVARAKPRNIPRAIANRQRSRGYTGRSRR